MPAGGRKEDIWAARSLMCGDVVMSLDRPTIARPKTDDQYRRTPFFADRQFRAGQNL